MADGLCSLNQLKSHLQIPTTETGLDAQLSPLIDAATSEWERVTGRRVLYQSYTKEPYQPGFVRDLALKNYPVDSAATFQLIRIDQYGQFSIVDASDYLMNWEDGIVTLLGALRFADRPDAITVTYSAGFKPTGAGADRLLAVSAQLTRAAQEYCAATMRQQARAISFDEAEKIRQAALLEFKRDARLW